MKSSMSKLRLKNDQPPQTSSAEGVEVAKVKILGGNTQVRGIFQEEVHELVA